MSQHHYTSGDIQEKIYTVVAEVSGLNASELDKSLSINDEIAPSSLDRVTLFMALEDEFSASIDEDELKDIESLGDLVLFVENKAGVASA